MKSRFEIPIPSPTYDIFAVDDFLRKIQSREEREKLIESVGISKMARDAFEQTNGLPGGAVELARRFVAD